MAGHAPSQSSDGNRLQKEREIEWEEVAKHNTTRDCWVSCRGMVYDVTGFVQKHPGGTQTLSMAAGRDITQLIPSYHPFADEKVYKTLKAYKIGVLKNERTQFGSYPKAQDDFYTVMRQRVGDYFTKNNVDPKSIWSGLWRWAFLTSLIFGCWYQMYFTEWWVYSVLLALVGGAAQALILIHTMHDLSHFAMSHSPTVWKYFAQWHLDWQSGCNIDSWYHQHVMGHHLYTNTVGADPDVPIIYDGDLRRVVANQKWYSMYAHQYLWLPAIYCFYALKVRIQDITHTFIGGNSGAIPVNPEFNGCAAAIRQFIAKTQWFVRVALVPYYFFEASIPTIIALQGIYELMTGYWLTWCFQASHIAPDLDWPVSLDESNGKNMFNKDWARVQIHTTVDYAYNFVTCFLTGNLNMQTIHHLFPSVSQYHYPDIAPIVMKVCKDYNVKFNYKATFVEAFGGHLRHLYDMGQKPKRDE